MSLHFSWFPIYLGQNSINVAHIKDVRTSINVVNKRSKHAMHIESKQSLHHEHLWTTCNTSQDPTFHPDLHSLFIFPFLRRITAMGLLSASPIAAAFQQERQTQQQTVQALSTNFEPVESLKCTADITAATKENRRKLSSTQSTPCLY